jgi:hypothetical protein
VTDEQLEDIEELAAQATPPPWNCFGQHLYHSGNKSLMWTERGGPVAIDKSADAMFIVYARGYVPQLIAEVRRLRVYERLYQQEHE